MEKRLIAFSLILVLIGVSACNTTSNNPNNSTDDDNEDEDEIEDDEDEVEDEEDEDETEDDNEDESNSTRPPAVPTNGEIITAAELAKHKTKEDCWISYKGNVYDLTNWLPKHPGTAGAIAPFCGTSSEFEKAFIDKHDTSKVDKLMEEGIYKGELR